MLLYHSPLACIVANRERELTKLLVTECFVVSFSIANFNEFLSTRKFKTEKTTATGIKCEWIKLALRNWCLIWSLPPTQPMQYTNRMTHVSLTFFVVHAREDVCKLLLLLFSDFDCLGKLFIYLVVSVPISSDLLFSFPFPFPLELDLDLAARNAKMRKETKWNEKTKLFKTKYN